MIESEFTLNGMSVWISDIAQKYLTTVRIVDCIPWGSKGGQAIFEIKEPRGRAPHIIKDITEHPDIIGLDMNNPEGGQLRGAVSMKSCGIIRIMMSSGCFLESATAEGDGVVRFKVLVGSGGSLPQLFQKLDERGMVPELQSLTRFSENEPLTKKQEDFLRLALEKGYFDYPRRIKAVDLAKMCGVSTATMREILSRGERNVLKRYFSDGSR